MKVGKWRLISVKSIDELDDDEPTTPLLQPSAPHTAG